MCIGSLMTPLRMNHNAVTNTQMRDNEDKIRIRRLSLPLRFVMPKMSQALIQDYYNTNKLNCTLSRITIM